MAGDEAVRADTETKGDDTVVVKLEYPIKQGEQVIEELVFARRPKAKDFKGIVTATGALSFDDQYLLIARLTNEPLSVILELDIADMGKAMKAFTSFIPDGLMTGGSR